MFKMFFSKYELFPVSWCFLSSCVLILHGNTLSEKELKERCGFKMSTNKNSTRNPSMSPLPGTRFMACEGVSCLPPSFTWLDHKERCPSLGHITNQLKCGSCWAVAAAAVISDRHCLETHEQRIFSAKHIAGCAMNDGGCYGGDPKDAMEYYVKHGVVTGEDPTLNEQSTSCVPYFIEKNHSFSCERTCESDYTVELKSPNPFESDKRRGVSSYTILTRDVTEIKLDLMRFGPLVTTMEIFDDFANYKNGTYKRSPNSKYIGAHAIRLIGWGKEDGIPYWICANSFGDSWGDMGGFFHIFLGQNECGIENYLIGVQTRDKAEIIRSQFSTKGPSTTHDPLTTTRPESCPSSMTYDPNYPNICYQIKERSDLYFESWKNTTNFCHQIDSRATLPVFHDLSEYISYSYWVYGRMSPHAFSCINENWLGISYNTTSKNYSWIDGSDVSFNFYDDHDNIVFDERFSFYHSIVGSNKWIQREKTRSFFAQKNVCQLRINKNSLLKTTTNGLDYPKSKKCPQKENWFYDDYSDICYYYDRHDRRNWTSALAHCKSEVGGSLPYFMTEHEFDSFVKLIRTLHVPCVNNIWLGYYGQNYSFVNVNRSTNSFLKWSPGYPKIHSDISYIYFSWYSNNFENEDSNIPEKNVFCQCRPGKCKAEKSAEIVDNQFNMKGLPTIQGSATISQPESCPSSMTYDSNYPNICYQIKERSDMYLDSWDDATNFCHLIDSRATLPIFHDLSEYISYRNWAYEHTPLRYCYLYSWLGISYNSTSKNYSWIDGSNVTFNFYDDIVFDESYSFYHSMIGSNKWLQREKTRSFFGLKNVCQLRINKNSLLKTTTNGLDYPKSKKCPQKENWFYDDYSDICYYYDRHDYLNWTSAFAHCKSEVGGSLPYFMTENEFDSFLKLIRTLHVPCVSNIWLGYYGQRYSFVNVNGSANSVLKWFSDYPKIHSTISYVYFNWYDNAFLNEVMDEKDIEKNIKSVFCQCRSGNCKTEKSGN